MKYNCETSAFVSMFLITALVGTLATVDVARAEESEQTRWEDKPIGALTTDLRPSEGELPEDIAAGVFAA